MLNPIRNYLSIRRDPIAFLSRIARDGGDFARFRVLAFPYVLVNEPALIREALADKSESLIIRGGTSAALARLIGHGILTNHGESWRDGRRGLQPLFHSEAMKSYRLTMAARIEESLERWRALPASVDVHQELLALSFRIASSTLFRWLPSFEDATAFAAAIRVLQLDGMERYVTGADLVPWLPYPMNRRVHSAKATLLRLAQEAAQSCGQPVDEIRSILFAGTESPVNTLCFALALLEDHPGWLARARDSAERTQSTPDGDEQELGGPLVQVISESLRLFPAGWAFERVAKEDVVIGGNPIRRGTRLIFSPFLLHRNRRLWSEPERFDPARFAKGTDVPKDGYLPFGAGPRSCIGVRIALLEMKLILGALLTRCRWSLLRSPAEGALHAEGSFKIRLSRPPRISLQVA